MPILETQPKRAFERFETHMAELVTSVLELPAGTVLSVTSKDASGTLGFTRGTVPTMVPVETRFGRLYVSLTQDLIAIREGRQFRLRTKRYAYKLFGSDDARADALIRWEFDSETDDGKECRNHMHVNAAFQVGHARFDLNRLHVPTAWVLVEHVLRFLFHDLEVPPRCTDWPDKDGQILVLLPHEAVVPPYCYPRSDLRGRFHGAHGCSCRDVGHDYLPHRYRLLVNVS